MIYDITFFIHFTDLLNLIKYWNNSLTERKMDSFASAVQIL